MKVSSSALALVGVSLSAKVLFVSAHRPILLRGNAAVAVADDTKSESLPVLGKDVPSYDAKALEPVAVWGVLDADAKTLEPCISVMHLFR